MTDEQLDVVTKALRRAWSLAQTHWSQADSESYSQNRKAYETQLKFERLVEDTRTALAAKMENNDAAPGRAVERAAYERAAAHVRTLKRDQWYLRVAPEIVVEECAVAIEKLMMQEQPR